MVQKRALTKFRFIDLSWTAGDKNSYVVQVKTVCIQGHSQIDFTSSSWVLDENKYHRDDNNTDLIFLTAIALMLYFLGQTRSGCNVREKRLNSLLNPLPERYAKLHSEEM